MPVDDAAGGRRREVAGSDRLKRAFDITIASFGLVVLAPVLVVAALVVVVGSGRPVFFRQERIGRDFEPFMIVKLRTMRDGAGPAVTVGEDRRITGVGRWLRRTKIDELPQLWNVLVGDMSLVGPRPEVAAFVDRFRDDYEVVLSVRPGITDEASLRYRRESDVLAAADDAASAYVEEILPDKLRLAKAYVQNRSMWGDIQIMVRTVLGRP